MSPFNDIEIGESMLLSIIKGIATIGVKTEYGVLYYKKDGNFNLN